MVSDWKIIHTELLFQNRWMELHEDKVEVGCIADVPVEKSLSGIFMPQIM